MFSFYLAECPPLGMESHKIEPDQLSASSMSQYHFAPQRARLNMQVHNNQDRTVHLLAGLEITTSFQRHWKILLLLSLSLPVTALAVPNYPNWRIFWSAHNWNSLKHTVFSSIVSWSLRFPGLRWWGQQERRSVVRKFRGQHPLVWGRCSQGDRVHWSHYSGTGLFTWVRRKHTGRHKHASFYISKCNT